MGCGLAKGNGGLSNPFGRLSMPGSASGVGECAAFAWGAISPVIEAVVVLVGVRSGLMGAGASWGEIGAVGLLGRAAARARGATSQFGRVTAG